MSDKPGFYFSRTDDLPFSVGKPPAPDPTPLALLMEMLRSGCAVNINHVSVCFYCESLLSVGSDPDYHHSDCPYLEAITLYGDPNYPGSPPTGVLKTCGKIANS